jgi:hypothetical protein
MTTHDLASSGPGADTAARLDRLESLDEIRQLAGRYALALDMRDADAWVGLYPEDVRVSRDLSGRVALKQWFDETMRQRFTGTAHVTGNHVIEFDDADHAHGIVYSRNEHEMDGEWVIMTMMYWDTYERSRDGAGVPGRWLFRRRLPLYWYATDLNRPPVGPDKMRWPDQEPYEGGFHDLWPSWARFWEQVPDGPTDVVEPAPLGQFLARMRGEGDLPSVRVR